jgi:Rrf2 family transcriptional regulator, iron-sulfur cluster assembly transcription factor
MLVLPRKAILAVAVIVDIAMQEDGRRRSAKLLAARLGLAPRHLEPILQSLVQHGILKGLRGPRGGYELAREPQAISVDTILRLAASAGVDDAAQAPSMLLNKAVLPMLAKAEREFDIALRRITIADIERVAQSEQTSGPSDRRVSA